MGIAVKVGEVWGGLFKSGKPWWKAGWCFRKIRLRQDVCGFGLPKPAATVRWGGKVVSLFSS